MWFYVLVGMGLGILLGALVQLAIEQEWFSKKGEDEDA